MSRILLSCLDRKLQWRIIKSLYGYAKVNNCDSVFKPNKVSDPLEGYDMAFEQFQNYAEHQCLLAQRSYYSDTDFVKMNTLDESVDNCISHLSQHVEYGYCQLVVNNIKQNLPIPCEDDEDAQIMISYVKSSNLSISLPTPVFYDSSCEEMESLSSIDAGADDSCRNSPTLTDLPYDIYSEICKHLDAKSIINFGQVVSLNFRLTYPGQQILKFVEAVQSLDSKDNLVKEEVESIASSEVVESKESVDDLLRDVRSPFSIPRVLKKLSSKWRRIAYRAIFGNPISMWEARKICSYIYEVIKYIPARIVRSVMMTAMNVRSYSLRDWAEMMIPLPKHKVHVPRVKIRNFAFSQGDVV